MLITNPDMLHQSLLPVHAQFARLLRALRYVVVDEAHAYKGERACSRPTAPTARAGQGWRLVAGREKRRVLACPPAQPASQPPTRPPAPPTHPSRPPAHPPTHPPQGVFGCHTALVLRRLRRLCEREYGARPVFAVTTATVANPREHARELLGVEEVGVIVHAWGGGVIVCGGCI